MINIKTTLVEATKRLQPTSTSARLDAELLLLEVLKKPRTFLYAYSDEPLTLEQTQAFDALVMKRMHGEPIAYLRGTQEFWSLELITTPDTLIPRPETELLVEFVLSKFESKNTCSVLELGTGTGAIAIALAHEKPAWALCASDYSEQALAIAARNIKHHQLNNITLLHSDWFESIPKQRFDVIISNPPYLAENDPHQHEGDLRFEPKSALLSGVDGLDALQHIIKQSPAYLKPGGMLVLEHGYEQAEVIRKELEQAGYTNIQCLQDHAGHDRITAADYRHHPYSLDDHARQD
jgi:release factor glutamine methyltransferase